VTAFYSIDDANARIEQVRPLLETLRAQRDDVARLGERLRAAQIDEETDASVAAVLRARIRAIVDQMEATVVRLDDWGVVLRDIGTGLVDLPALVGGRPVWLCWRLGEPTLSFAHRQDQGFDQRLPLDEFLAREAGRRPGSGPE
jgi:hypothetical protein